MLLLQQFVKHPDNDLFSACAIAIQVKAGGTYHSCCVVVKKMQRCVYAVPNASVFDSYETMKLEKDVEESRISQADFHAKLLVCWSSHASVFC